MSQAVTAKGTGVISRCKIGYSTDLRRPLRATEADIACPASAAAAPWIGVVYVGSLFALLLQSFYSLDDYSGLIVRELHALDLCASSLGDGRTSRSIPHGDDEAGW